MEVRLWGPLLEADICQLGRTYREQLQEKV